MDIEEMIKQYLQMCEQLHLDIREGNPFNRILFAESNELYMSIRNTGISQEEMYTRYDAHFGTNMRSYLDE